MNVNREFFVYLSELVFRPAVRRSVGENMDITKEIQWSDRSPFFGGDKKEVQNEPLF